MPAAQGGNTAVKTQRLLGNQTWAISTPNLEAGTQSPLMESSQGTLSQSPVGSAGECGEVQEPDTGLLMSGDQCHRYKCCPVLREEEFTLCGYLTGKGTFFHPRWAQGRRLEYAVKDPFEVCQRHGIAEMAPSKTMGLSSSNLTGSCSQAWEPAEPGEAAVW